MMKIKKFAVIGILLVASLIFLTACTISINENGGNAGNTTNSNSNSDNNSNSNNNSNSDNNINSDSMSLVLELDDRENTKKKYSATFNLSKKYELQEFYEDERNYAQYMNKKENYFLDFLLETKEKEHYDDYRKVISEDEEWKETKFGKYDGEYFYDDDSVVGYVYLDTSDPKYNVTIFFTLVFPDDDPEERFIIDIFNTSNVQDILNNIEFDIKK